ncbi:hypothetical protein ACV229_16540 [Burkholderia sp. MR1-5-21]
MFLDRLRLHAIASISCFARPNGGLFLVFAIQAMEKLADNYNLRLLGPAVPQGT